MRHSFKKFNWEFGYKGLWPGVWCYERFRQRNTVLPVPSRPAQTISILPVHTEGWDGARLNSWPPAAVFFQPGCVLRPSSSSSAHSHQSDSCSCSPRWLSRSCWDDTITWGWYSSVEVEGGKASICIWVQPQSISGPVQPSHTMTRDQCPVTNFVCLYQL